MKHSAVDSPVYILRMSKILNADCAAPVLPTELTLNRLQTSNRHAIYTLLELAYKDGFGSLPAFDDWWQRLMTDPEYDPDLSWVLCDREGIVAVAQCWTSSFVKDLVVHPRRQRQGIGRLLLELVFAGFKERGARSVELKVHENNVAALQLYKKADMKMIGRISV